MKMLMFLLNANLLRSRLSSFHPGKHLLLPDDMGSEYHRDVIGSVVPIIYACEVFIPVN